LKQRSGERRTQQLSESLHRQLNSYALAASAAGVSLLALARPAQAEIVYTPVDVIIRPHHHYHLCLNHDQTDFTLANFSSGSGEWRASVFEKAAPGNGAMGYISNVRTQAWVVASALRPGSSIGPLGHFKLGKAKLIYAWSNSGCSGSAFGPWYGGQNRYLGLKFQIQGKTHYGWARLSIQYPDYRTITATLIGYAYETIPNKAIIAGKTHGKDVIIVEPASLGHLARGASAVSAWRRTKSAAAAH